MNKKKRIEVTINGQKHAFISSDSEEYIQELAGYLNEKILEVTNVNFGNLLPNDRKYVVVAMNILDDYYKALSKLEELKGSGADDLSAKTKAEYEEKIFDIKRQCEAIVREYESRFNAVEKENKDIKKEYERKAAELKARSGGGNAGNAVNAGNAGSVGNVDVVKEYESKIESLKKTHSDALRELENKINESRKKNSDVVRDYENRIEEMKKERGVAPVGNDAKYNELKKGYDKMLEDMENLKYELDYVQNLYKEQKQEYEKLLEEATAPSAD